MAALMTSRLFHVGDGEEEVDILYNIYYIYFSNEHKVSLDICQHFFLTNYEALSTIQYIMRSIY